jgi:uncharacterized protein DUF3309
MPLITILIIVLVSLLIGALPSWPYSVGWGFYPSGLLGLILVIIIILGVLGRVLFEAQLLALAGGGAGALAAFALLHDWVTYVRNAVFSVNFYAHFSPGVFVAGLGTALALGLGANGEGRRGRPGRMTSAKGVWLAALRWLMYLAAPLLLLVSGVGTLVSDPKSRISTIHRHLRARFWNIYFGFGRPRYRGVHQLVRHPELFERPGPPAALGAPATAGAHDVIVVDNFYDDPDAVRAFALGLSYVPYRNWLGIPFWFSSALEVADNPLKGKGVRLLGPGLYERMCELTCSRIDRDTWETAGDGWNGAFHYKIRALPTMTSAIHNHTGRPEDVIHGWSGLIYLTPGVRRSNGTTIWRSKKTGKCFSTESVYDLRFSDYEMVFDVENVYNRLVLFYASVFHMGNEGFGSRLENARLFQTFFFNTR